MNYEIRIKSIEAENGDQWLAYYPDLPGCAGSGNTKLEALLMAEEEKDIMIEALNLIGEPLPKETADSQYSGKFTVRISKSMHEKASICADKEGISLNALVGESLAERVTCSNVCEEIEERTADKVMENLYKGYGFNFGFQTMHITGSKSWKN